MSTKRTLTAALVLVTLGLLLAPTAAAHKTAYSPDGDIKIVWGFLDEPAVTWTKTGLDLRLSDNATGDPIAGAEATLNVSLRHGEDEILFEDLAGRHGTPGAYTHPITLTKPGLYTLVLRGTIDGTAVDMQIPGAHEIHGIDETYFPETDQDPFAPGAASGGDTSALQAEIDALEARLAALESKIVTQATTPATVTEQTPANDVPAPGVLALALGLVAAALILRRRA